MKPTKHPQCNDVLRAPAGSTDCDDLHIRREDGEVWSFWEPNTEELAAMALGGPVMLRVCGQTHPPLSLHVMQPDQAVKAMVPEASFRHLYDNVRVQFGRLLDVTKRTLSAWSRECPESAERSKMTDQFLYMLHEWKGGQIVKDEPMTEADAKLIADLTGQLEKVNEVAKYWQERCKSAEADRDTLQRWKDEALAVESTWAPQLVADELGIYPGFPIRENILPHVVALKNRLAMAEAARDTEREMRIAAEANLKSLASYAEGGLGQPVSGIAVGIRDEIVRLRKLASEASHVPDLREEIERLRAEVLSLEAVVDRVKEAINPNPQES